ncbi:MAG TPA: hypothetical protein VF516_39100 [Kofleriaceae bacterium]
MDFFALDNTRATLTLVPASNVTMQGFHARFKLRLGDGREELRIVVGNQDARMGEHATAQCTARVARRFPLITVIFQSGRGPARRIACRSCAGGQSRHNRKRGLLRCRFPVSGGSPRGEECLERAIRAALAPHAARIAHLRISRLLVRFATHRIHRRSGNTDESVPAPAWRLLCTI